MIIYVDEITKKVKIYEITILHENKEEVIYLLLNEGEAYFLFPKGTEERKE